MKPSNCQFVASPRDAVRILVLLSLICCEAWAQSLPTNSAAEIHTGDAGQELHAVELSVDLDGDRNAEVVLEFESSFEPKYNFPQLLSNALGCQLRAMELTRDHERNKTILAAECEVPVHRAPFTQTGSIDLSSISSILNSESKPGLFLRISIPNRDFVRCDPAPAEFYQSATIA